MALIVRDLTVEIDNKRIVEKVSFDVRAGDKVGLVGRNGAGKTTLFRALGGATTPKSGSVRLPEATGYLSQDPRSDDVDLSTTPAAKAAEAVAKSEVDTEGTADDEAQDEIMAEVYPWSPRGSWAGSHRCCDECIRPAVGELFDDSYSNTTP